MICPQCKAEYRQGFTECSDCHVPLVASPAAAGDDSKGIPTGTLVPLWEGENLALHTSLLEELDAAGIRYFSQPMGIYPGARRADPFPVQAMTRFGYQVAVLSSDLRSSKGILEKLLEDEPQDMELPAQVEATDAEPQRPANAEEDPTIEVWVGEDDQFSNFLQDALRENAISVRVETSSSENKVFVPSSDAPRAREIVRELTEAAPPE